MLSPIQLKDADMMNSLMGLFSMNFENLLNLPCYVFWKDIQGTYLGYNDYGANNLGYCSGKEIGGKKDPDIFPTSMASLYRQNDIEAMQQNKQIFVPEKGVLKDNLPIIFLSYKIPLYHQDEVAGVLGFSFTRPADDKICHPPAALSPDKFADRCNYFPPQKNSSHLPLSQKEKECVQYLCQGLTMKMIARQLRISPKTVETYIERAKIKLDCQNKSQLVIKFIKHFVDI